VRECREETGFTVRMGELMFISEYIGKNHEFAKFDADVHQVDLHFLCEVDRDRAPVEITGPDYTQIGIEWMEMERFPMAPIYPKYLRTKIPDFLAELRGKLYMGDIN